MLYCSADIRGDQSGTRGKETFSPALIGRKTFSRICLLLGHKKTKTLSRVYGTRVSGVGCKLGCRQLYCIKPRCRSGGHVPEATVLWRKLKPPCHSGSHAQKPRSEATLHSAAFQEATVFFGKPPCFAAATLFFWKPRPDCPVDPRKPRLDCRVHPPKPRSLGVSFNQGLVANSPRFPGLSDFHDRAPLRSARANAPAPRTPALLALDCLHSLFALCSFSSGSRIRSLSLPACGGKRPATKASDSQVTGWQLLSRKPRLRSSLVCLQVVRQLSEPELRWRILWREGTGVRRGAGGGGNTQPSRTCVDVGVRAGARHLTASRCAIGDTRPRFRAAGFGDARCV